MRAGTIVASNYLEMARLLARSFLDQHPDDTFVVLLVDDEPVEVADDEGFEVVRLGDLDLGGRELDMMKTIYDVMELSTAVKPSFLRLLLTGDPVAVYLDPDIYVYAPFGDLVEPAREVGIVLTPHVLHPIPRDGTLPTERNIMGSGIFNLGFIAVGGIAADFLDWWQERLLVDAVSDIEANLFTDQRWIDWVPAIFGCAVCRDPGMNIAWWNIHERELVDEDDGTVSSEGSPVRFVHFSGYDPGLPDQFSKHQQKPRTAHSQGTVIRRLADEYGEALEANGHHERRRTPYQWNRTAEGRDLPPFVRSVVRRALLHGERTGTEAGPLDDSVPFAFGPTSDRFEDWLTGDSGVNASTPVSRLELGLYRQRPDLQAAFPDLAGPAAADFRRWLDTDPSVRDALGDRWDPQMVDLTSSGASGSTATSDVSESNGGPSADQTSIADDGSASGVASAQRRLATRLAGRARRELVPYVERARARVGR